MIMWAAANGKRPPQDLTIAVAKPMRAEISPTKALARPIQSASPALPPVPSVNKMFAA